VYSKRNDWVNIPCLIQIVCYFLFICEWRSKPGEETSGGVAFIGQGSPVKQGDEDDGKVSRREMSRREMRRDEMSRREMRRLENEE
jgi:hypothetical protein